MEQISARDTAVQNVSNASRRERFVDRVGGMSSVMDLAERVGQQADAAPLVDDKTADRALDSVAAAIVAVEALRAELAAVDAKDLAIERAADLMLEAGALIATVRRIAPFKDRVDHARAKKADVIGVDG